MRFSSIILLLLFAGCNRNPKYGMNDANSVCDTENLVQDGAWFGRNTTKIARYGNTVFTYIMPNDADYRHIILYKKTDGQAWEKGMRMAVTRAPNLIVDSKGCVHIVGHRVFDDSDQTDGQLFHSVFKNPMDIVGKHTFEFITPDWRLNRTPDTYATYYAGATIDRNDVITVVYCNSATHSQYPSLASISNNRIDGGWHYASVSDSMSSRLCYPYVVNGRLQQHIVSVEDQYDAALESTGYPYRYGKVEHLFKANEAEQWKSETLFNLNGKYSKADIANSLLRVADVLYDANDTLHVLLRMAEFAVSINKPDSILGTKLIYLRKHELDTQWLRIQLPFLDYTGPRLWECPDGQIVLVGINGRNSAIDMVSLSSFLKKTDNRFEGYWGNDPYLFLSNKRNTALANGHGLDIVLFDGTASLPAKASTNLQYPCMAQ
jgi:hypothetical protein